MTEQWQHELEAWRELFLLLGSVGATLLALMFVVVTLGPRFVAQQTATGVRAFFTPIIVIFTCAFVVSALMMTPRIAPPVLATALTVIGVGGLSYLSVTGAHAQYRASAGMVRVDWVWFVGLPYVGYALLIPAGIAIWLEAAPGIYAVEAAVVVFILIGIRNAWEAVLWIAGQARE